MVDAIDDLQPLDLVEHDGLPGPAHEIATLDLTNVDTQGILMQACGFPIQGAGR